MMMGQSPAQSAGEGTPASTNIMGAEYPKVHDDLSVSFRVEAPDAKKVQLDLGKLWDMERDSEGVWSMTIPPQVPGFHYYYLNIDGVRVSDPASESFYGVRQGVQRHRDSGSGRECICSTVAARTKPAGPSKGALTSSWTT